MDDVVKTLQDHRRKLPTPSLPARPSRQEAEAAVRTLVAYTGDNPDREGLVETPRRVVAAFDELYAGYAMDPADALTRVFSDVNGYDDIVLVRDIPFASHCEHHMLPFTGRVHVGYYPSREGVVGLSKLARLVDIYARRLQTQETMTAQILDALDIHLQPRGAAVMVEAEHMCMALRGVRKIGTSTVTTQFSGSFQRDPTEQMRFLTLLRQGR